MREPLTSPALWPSLALHKTPIRSWLACFGLALVIALPRPTEALAAEADGEPVSSLAATHDVGVHAFAAWNSGLKVATAGLVRERGSAIVARNSSANPARLSRPHAAARRVPEEMPAVAGISTALHCTNHEDLTNPDQSKAGLGTHGV